MTTKMQVSCFACFTINTIGIGTDFYDAEAIYECYNCHKIIHVSVSSELCRHQQEDYFQLGEAYAENPNS